MLLSPLHYINMISYCI